MPVEGFCEACREIQHADDFGGVAGTRSCPICGGDLIAPPSTSSAQTQAQQHVLREGSFESIAQGLAALMAQEGHEGEAGGIPGLDLPELFGAMPPSASRVTASAAAIRALPRYSVEDEGSWVLHTTEVTLTPGAGGGQPTSRKVQLEGMLARFSSRSQEVVQGPLVAAQPLLADSVLVNADALRGSVVVVQRGRCTFAAKAARAQAAGAAAVVVLNTCDTWPYVMTDSQGEAEASALTIPVAMVSEQDGDKLLQVVQRHAAVRCHLSTSSSSRECVICQEPYTVGTQVVKLPCAHMFHEGCVTNWLSRHSSTCPTCRGDVSVHMEQGQPVAPQWTDWFG